MPLHFELPRPAMRTTVAVQLWCRVPPTVRANHGVWSFFDISFPLHHMGHPYKLGPPNATDDDNGASEVPRAESYERTSP